MMAIKNSIVIILLDLELLLGVLSYPPKFACYCMLCCTPGRRMVYGHCRRNQ